MAGRIAWLSARLMIRPTLSVGSFLPSAPWPWGLVEFAARAITPTPQPIPVTFVDRNFRRSVNRVAIA